MAKARPRYKCRCRKIGTTTKRKRRRRTSRRRR